MSEKESRGFVRGALAALFVTAVSLGTLGAVAGTSFAETSPSAGSGASTQILAGGNNKAACNAQQKQAAAKAAKDTADKQAAAKKKADAAAKAAADAKKAATAAAAKAKQTGVQADKAQATKTQQTATKLANQATKAKKQANKQTKRANQAAAAVKRCATKA